MRINPFVYGILVLSLFTGVIFAFRSAGVWSISGKADAQGNRVAPSADDPETIKGWMTLGEIAAAYQVTLDEIIAQFQLPTDTPAETAVKDLESETFSVSGLREWLAARIEQDGSLPPPAQVVTPAPTQTVPTPAPQELPATQLGTGQGQPADQALSEDHAPPERRVNAKTTFQDLLDWGLSVQVISQIIGTEMPTPGTVVKDFITSNGGEFASIKSALQAEIDKINP